MVLGPLRRGLLRRWPDKVADLQPSGNLIPSPSELSSRSPAHPLRQPTSRRRIKAQQPGVSALVNSDPWAIGRVGTEKG